MQPTHPADLARFEAGETVRLPNHHRLGGRGVAYWNGLERLPPMPRAGGPASYPPRPTGKDDALEISSVP